MNYLIRPALLIQTSISFYQCLHWESFQQNQIISNLSTIFVWENTSCKSLRYQGVVFWPSTLKGPRDVHLNPRSSPNSSGKWAIGSFLPMLSDILLKLLTPGKVENSRCVFLFNSWDMAISGYMLWNVGSLSDDTWSVATKDNIEPFTCTSALVPGIPS